MPSLARKRIEDEQEVADSQPMPEVRPVQEAQPNPNVEQTSGMQAAAEEQPEPDGRAGGCFGRTRRCRGRARIPTDSGL